jgi:predicted histone-like DNA-binding protein
MAITYQVKKVKNPKGIEGANYYAARAVKTSDYTFDELAEDINNSTTVTQADAFAVLKSMKKYVKQALLAGRRVVLSDLGAFRVALTGKCYPREVMENKDFMPSAMIKGIRVGFRPEAKLLREIRAEHSLKRVSSDAMK